MSDLLVGFARVDISPRESVPLGGYGRSSMRMSDGVDEPLLATCLALQDANGEQALVFSFDLGNMTAQLQTLRAELARELDMPTGRVMFCCTHTHSAPHLGNGEQPSIPRYLQLLKSQVLLCARQALADRKPATLAAGSVTTQNMNFVRRYLLADGTYAGDNFGHPKLSPYVGHETPGDPQLQVVKLSREGAQDIVMINFQGHPHRGARGHFSRVSSDLIYHLRQRLEAEEDCLSVYFTGASGNMNCASRIEEENITPDYIAQGHALADYARTALQSLHPLPAGPLRTLQTVYVGRCNHLEDHKLEAARVVVERWEGGAKTSEALRGYEELFNSPYHATSIIGKAARPETMEVELNVLTLGGFAMAFAPFELFAELGMAIKANGLFDTTFVSCYANGLFSYMPTLLGFEHGGYGPNQCRFEPGTGEELVKQFTGLLQQLA